MKRYTIDARDVTSFEDFVAAVNVGFIQHVGGTWHGNLDAFNDYLSWPEDSEYEIELLGLARCVARLGHAALADRLRANLQACHPSNLDSVRMRLALAEAGEGETLFDVIREILAENPHVRVLSD